MAVTAQGRALTEAHRLAQVQLRLTTIAQLAAVWGLLDITALDRTTPAWLAAAQPIIAQNFDSSTALARGYFRAFRAAETGASGQMLLPTPVLAVDAVRTSLVVTGPVRVKIASSRGIDMTRVSELGQRSSAEAGARQALTGGRELITQAALADRRAVGWERVASGDACDFCQQLVDWSQTNPALQSDFQAHDHCGCSAEPVYA